MKQKFIYSEQYHDYLRLLGEAGGAYVISEPDGDETYWDKTEYKYEPIEIDILQLGTNVIYLPTGKLGTIVITDSTSYINMYHLESSELDVWARLKPLIYKYLEIDDFYRIECETETHYTVIDIDGGRSNIPKDLDDEVTEREFLPIGTTVVYNVNDEIGVIVNINIDNIYVPYVIDLGHTTVVADFNDVDEIDY